MEQLLVFLVFGAVVFVQWLLKQAQEKRQQRPPRPHEQRPLSTPPSPGAGGPLSGDPEAERMRKFLEALGIPADQAPPPPVQPRPAPQQPMTSAPPPIPKPGPPPLRPAESAREKQQRRLARKLEEQRRKAEAQRRQELARNEEVVEGPTTTIIRRGGVEDAVDAMSAAAEKHMGMAHIPDGVKATEIGSGVRSGKRWEAGEPVPGLRSVLRDRESLRNAVLLREVLGPPKALQGA